MITVKNRKSFRLFRRYSSSKNEGLGFLLFRPLLPRLFTSFQLGFKGWRVVGVGNCFEHLTESVRKFWPTLRIFSSPYLREPDECRSYKSCTCVNIVVDCSLEIPAEEGPFSQPERHAKNCETRRQDNTCSACKKVWRRTIFHSQTQDQRVQASTRVLRVRVQNDQVQFQRESRFLINN